MRLLLSIPMALLGSLFGSALRSGLKVLDTRLESRAAGQMDITINGSALAALGGGVMGLLFGTRTAFWSGMALGAAGIDRFDVRLLRMAGIDVDAMIQRARTMADQAGGAGETAAEAVEEDAGQAAEFTVESPASEPA
ncbi:MAG TPA: hypothetical protein VF153_01765 [Candidatus Limnocylindria bacterium]